MTTTTSRPGAAAADLDAAAGHCAAMLAALGVAEHGDARTARRHVRALAELTGGLREDPAAHLGVTFAPVSSEPGLVAVAGVEFQSVCAHHFLPFAGVFAVAYLPKPEGRIVGLSKLARMVLGYARRPQVQEQIAAQVVTALMTNTQARGAAIALRATHSCMALRGARTGVAAAMVTTDAAGELRDSPWREQFAAIAAPVLAG